MEDVLDEAFDDPAERRAYEEFVAAQERGAEPFDLERPALVCRWRMAGKHVPLLNRHIRALAARHVNGTPLSPNLISWAKQHVEWSLAEGDVADPDGVLMLVVDVNGNAAMSTGPYAPLDEVTCAALVKRGADAQREAGETGVAPEVLCELRETSDGVELVFLDGGGAFGGDGAVGAREAGVASLVRQLAQTKGIPVTRDGFRSASLEDAHASADMFLASDEHGIVAASDRPIHPFVQLCIDGYKKLCDRAR